MQLLSAQEVKTNKDTTAEEQAVRIGKLNQHETEATRRMNEALALEKEVRARVERDVAKVEKHAEEKKADLIKEVTALEARKREAEKPIQMTLAHAESLVNENEQVKTALQEREKEIEAKEEQVSERLEALGEREEGIKEQEEMSQERENRAKMAETQSEQSARNLGQKWNEYHAAVHAFNEEIAKKNALVEAGKQANIEVKRANDAESARLVQERRALQDAQIELGEAKRHLRGNDQHHG